MHRSAYSLCASGHRRVLEYSLSYSLHVTRVTNYSVSAALIWKSCYRPTLNLLRSSADADSLTNQRNAFRGQARSPNMVPFHMLGIVSY